VTDSLGALRAAVRPLPVPRGFSLGPTRRPMSNEVASRAVVNSR
jgi:hypothetical protein